MASDIAHEAPKEQESSGLAHTLQSRHVAMIAFGGIIGAGLFVGSSAAINVAGPTSGMEYPGIVFDDPDARGRTPERNKGQHDRGGYDEAYATRGCCRCFLEGHSVLTFGCALCAERQNTFPDTLRPREEALLPVRRTRLSVERMGGSVNAPDAKTCHVTGRIDP